MQVVLEIETGKRSGEQIRLQSGQILIVGRQIADGLACADDLIMSRTHFQLECDDVACRLRDLGSSNGTFVNGKRVKGAVLKHGDRILAGKTRFTVYLIQTPFAASFPAAPNSTSTAGANATVVERGPQSAAIETLADSDARPTMEDLFGAAFQDQDAGVRQEALTAAVWTRQAGLLDACRRAGHRPAVENFELLMTLAILGAPSDLGLIQQMARVIELGPQRFRIFGAYGHPESVPFLLDAMTDDDAPTAIAAGAAFTKITGVDIDSDQRVKLPPEDGSEPDEFEQEFLEEAKLPDPQRAQAHWDKVREEFAQGSRWCRGFDLSDGCSAALMEQLDLESRWETCLRERYRGTWHGNLLDLEKFTIPEIPEAAQSVSSEGRGTAG